MADHGESNGLQWYVAHTYSGYENKVKANLEKAVENNGMQDLIKEIRVPVEEVVEIKNGKRRTIQRKVFPGYVMVKMLLTNDTWYVVRNTRGVTGFVGPGSRPVPLTDEEVANIGELEEQTVINLSYKVGDSVKITAGFLKDAVGKVAEISDDKKKIMVIASMFGRDMPVELGSDEVTLLEG